MAKKKARRQRRYSDEFRAEALAALAANGGNTERTAEQLGIPETTLRQWARGDRHAEAAQMSEQKKGPLADHLEEVAYRLVSLMPAKAEAADLKQIAVAVGVAVDKIRLLRDQPTSINGQALSDAERAERLRALVDEFRAAGGVGPDSGGAAAPVVPPAGQ